MRVKLWEESITDMTMEDMTELLVETEAKVIELNFNHLPGDTLKERYESVHQVLVETSKEIEETINEPVNFIYSSVQLAFLFEFFDFSIQDVLGIINPSGAEYIGKVNKRWNLYQNANMPDTEFFIGHIDEVSSFEISRTKNSTSLFRITNFIG